MSERARPVRRPPVSWLAPGVLWRSAAEVVLSRLFADFADKREIEAGLSAESFPCSVAESESYWLDYASDVGDGFDATYTIAHLLAAPQLEVGGETTCRGRVLVLGGDEVYPSASWKNYDERFTGPYAAALPDIADEGQRPDMFAVPGNHDWYDGLTNFMRLFCQGADLGGWKRRQRRSYFALELPHRWWLWGIDIQFDAYIDTAQLDYFTRVAKRTAKGDRIILATAKPSWVHVTANRPRPQSWQNLAFFEEHVVRRNGATLAVTITGDLHHYSRYMPVDGGGPKITAGGGGAYLSPTHWLPESVDLPPLGDGPARRHRLGACWPDRATSLDMRKGILEHLLPWRTFGLNVVLVAIYGLLALLVAVGVKDQGTSFEGALDEKTVPALVGDSVTVWLLIAAVVVVAALMAWAKYGDAPPAAGLLHALVQLAAIVVLTLGLLSLDPLGAGDNGFWSGYLVGAIVGLFGALAGRAILTLYLFLCQLPGGRAHANEVFAAQSRRAGSGFKHFVRFRIDPEGLTMFVIGARDVPRRWSNDVRPEPIDGWPKPELVDRWPRARD